MPAPGTQSGKTTRPTNFPMDGAKHMATPNTGYKKPSYPSQNVPSENRGTAASKGQREYASKG